MEFLDLSRCTKDTSFEKATSGISKKVHDLQKNQGLVPIFINPNTGKFRKGSTVTLGARGDSYYEYLLKQWIQTGKTTNYLKEDFVESVIGVRIQYDLLLMGLDNVMLIIYEIMIIIDC